MLREAQRASAMGRSDERDSPFFRLGVMMERLVLDPATALECEPVELGLAIQRCRACECDVVCGNWLARTAARIEAPPVFCPNADLFARLRVGCLF